MQAGTSAFYVVGGDVMAKAKAGDMRAAGVDGSAQPARAKSNQVLAWVKRQNLKQWAIGSEHEIVVNGESVTFKVEGGESLDAEHDDGEALFWGTRIS